MIETQTKLLKVLSVVAVLTFLPPAAVVAQEDSHSTDSWLRSIIAASENSRAATPIGQVSTQTGSQTSAGEAAEDSPGWTTTARNAISNSFSNAMSRFGFGSSDSPAAESSSARVPEPTPEPVPTISPVQAVVDTDASELTMSGLAAHSADELRALTETRTGSFLNMPVSAPRRSRAGDLNASYAWESPRFGQFVVSTRTSQSQDIARDIAFEPGLLSSTDISALAAPVPELQSSLRLTWQIGNHTATAVTHYGAETFDDITAMDLEKFDELFGHMATLDIRYGYNIRTGSQGNTEISVGVRNLFDRRPASQWIESTSRTAVDANGRVAYGTIKYQF